MPKINGMRQHGNRPPRSGGYDELQARTYLGLEARQRRPRSVKMSALGLTQALRLPSASAEGEPATAGLEASQRSERRLPGLEGSPAGTSACATTLMLQHKLATLNNQA